MATFSGSHNIDKKYAKCPYEPNHFVPINRMAVHLAKCEKTSDKILLVCPFNALHRVPKEQMQFHLNQCPSRVTIINRDSDANKEIRSQEAVGHLKTELKREPVDPSCPTDGDENWD